MPSPDHHHRAAGSHFIAAAEKIAEGLLISRSPCLVIATPPAIHRAKAGFMAAQGTKARIGIAIQQHRAVNTVLQHLRPGQRAIFGHMTYHDDRLHRAFRKTRQIGRCVSRTLCDAAWRRLNVSHMHHRIESITISCGFSSSAIWQICSMLVSGEHIEISGRQPQAVKAHRYLLQRLFPGDVQRFHVFRQSAQRLQQQRRFTRPGLPPIRIAAWHHATAETRSNF